MVILLEILQEILCEVVREMAQEKIRERMEGKTYLTRQWMVEINIWNGGIGS